MQRVSADTHLVMPYGVASWTRAIRTGSRAGLLTRQNRERDTRAHSGSSTDQIFQGGHQLGKHSLCRQADHVLEASGVMCWGCAVYLHGPGLQPCSARLQGRPESGPDHLQGRGQLSRRSCQREMVDTYL